MNKVLLLALVSLLAACGKQTDNAPVPASQSRAQSEPGSGPAAAEVKRNMDFASVTRGGRLFAQHCADCHGARAEGAANWRKQDAAGKFPPPPLDGTGHAWHHSIKVLKMTIRDGTGKLGGTMPAWGDKLSEQDMTDLINWIQSRWPDDIYATWYRNQQGN